MEYRSLDLTLVSAKGLTKASTIFGKSNVYAVASISDPGTVCEVRKFKTPVHKDGGLDPTWNFPMKFTVNETACLENRSTLIVKIKGTRMLMDKNLGEVRVPIKELMEGVKAEGKSMQIVSYPVRGRSGDMKGVLSFSYKFGKLFPGIVWDPVTPYPFAYYQLRAVRGAGQHAGSSNGFGTSLSSWP